MDVTGNAAARRKDIEEWIRNNARFTGGAYFSNKTQLLTDSNPTLFEKGRINTWKRVVIRDPNQASLITILLAISKEFRQLPLSRQESVARQFRKQYMASSIPVLKEEDRKRVADDTQPIADGDFKFLLKYLELNVLAVQVVLDQSTNLYDETFKVVSSDPANPNVLDVEYEPNPKYENNDAITVLAVREPTTDPNNRGIYYYPIFQDYFFKPSMILTANEIKIIKKDFEDQTKTPGVVWKTIKVVGDAFKTVAKKVTDWYRPFNLIQKQAKLLNKLKYTLEGIQRNENEFTSAAEEGARIFDNLKTVIDVSNRSTLYDAIYGIASQLKLQIKSMESITNGYGKAKKQWEEALKYYSELPSDLQEEFNDTIEELKKIFDGLYVEFTKKQKDRADAIQKAKENLDKFKSVLKDFNVVQTIPVSVSNLFRNIIPRAATTATRFTKEKVVLFFTGHTQDLFILLYPIIIPVVLTGTGVVLTLKGIGGIIAGLSGGIRNFWNYLKDILSSLRGTDDAKAREAAEKLKELFEELRTPGPPPPPPPGPPPPPVSKKCENMVKYSLKGKSSLTYDEYKELWEDPSLDLTKDEVDECLRLKGIPIPTPPPPPPPVSKKCERMVKYSLNGKSSLTYDEYKELWEDPSLDLTKDEVDECLRLKGIPIPTPVSIFFERQNKLLSCGRHALNNMVGKEMFVFDKANTTPIDLTVLPSGPVNLYQLCNQLTVEQKKYFPDQDFFECRDNEYYNTTLLTAALDLIGYEQNIEHYSGSSNNLFLSDFGKNDYNYGIVNLGASHWVSLRYEPSTNTYYYFDSLSSNTVPYQTNNKDEIMPQFKDRFMAGEIYKYTGTSVHPLRRFNNILSTTFGGSRRLKTYRQQHRLPSIAKRLRTFRR